MKKQSINKAVWTTKNYEQSVIEESIANLNKLKKKIQPDQAVDIHLLSEELI